MSIQDELATLQESIDRLADITEDVQSNAVVLSRALWLVCEDIARGETRDPTDALYQSYINRAKNEQR